MHLYYKFNNATHDTQFLALHFQKSKRNYIKIKPPNSLVTQPYPKKLKKYTA